MLARKLRLPGDVCRFADDFHVVWGQNGCKGSGAAAAGEAVRIRCVASVLRASWGPWVAHALGVGSPSNVSAFSIYQCVCIFNSSNVSALSVLLAILEALQWCRM